MVTIVRRSPFHELDWMERGMRRMFDEFGFAPSIVPAADVYETENEFVVELDVPGFDHKELGIAVTDHTLVLTGEREEVKAEPEKDFRLRERLEERFERRFHLPPDAAPSRAAQREGPFGGPLSTFVESVSLSSTSSGRFRWVLPIRCPGGASS